MSEPTTTEPVTAKPPLDLDQLILKIPAKRWFLIRRALNMPTGEILEDLVAQLVVAANERNRKTTKKDDFVRFLEMTFEELSAFVGVEVAGDDDSKSDAPTPVVGGGADGREPAVAAAGGPDRLLDGEGAVLSGDGDAPG